MPVVYPCPLCGRSVNRRGRPLDEPGKTKSHIDGGHDERHDGEKGEDHMEDIRENAVNMETSELPAKRHQNTQSNRDDTPTETRVVEIPMGDGETISQSIPEAIQLNREIVTNPESFGLVSEAETQELQKRIDSLQESVEELERDIRILGAATGKMDVRCVCGGEVRKPGIFGGDPECTKCGRVGQAIFG